VRLCPSDVRGTESGTAENLAHFIVQDMAGTDKTLLYLTGDKNRDTLQKVVETESGMKIALMCVQVYATVGVELDVLEQNLVNMLEGAGQSSDHFFILRWLIKHSRRVMVDCLLCTLLRVTRSPRPSTPLFSRHYRRRRQRPATEALVPRTNCSHWPNNRRLPARRARVASRCGTAKAKCWRAGGEFECGGVVKQFSRAGTSTVTYMALRIMGELALLFYYFKFGSSFNA
jgi:hypothetical protein